jgi:hypothetical protein
VRTGCVGGLKRACMCGDGTEWHTKLLGTAYQTRQHPSLLKLTTITTHTTCTQISLTLTPAGTWTTRTWWAARSLTCASTPSSPATPRSGSSCTGVCVWGGGLGGGGGRVVWCSLSRLP